MKNMVKGIVAATALLSNLALFPEDVMAQDDLTAIIEKSFAECPVCHDIEEHKEHMSLDPELRKLLTNPEDVETEVEALETLEIPSEDTELNTEVVETEETVEASEEVETQETVESAEVAEQTGEVAEAVETPAEAEVEMQVAEVVQEVTEVEVQQEITIQEEVQEELATEIQEPVIEETVVVTEEVKEEVVEAEALVTEETVIEEQEAEAEEVVKTEVTKEVKVTSEEEELDLLYRLVQAEAGIENSRCKEMVTAVILNRVRSQKFPNTVKGVIYAPGQFAVISNNSINRVKVTSDTIEAVNRVYYGEKDVPSNIYYFRNNHYFTWCTPAFSIGNTYFSSIG